MHIENHDAHVWVDSHWQAAKAYYNSSAYPQQARAWDDAIMVINEIDSFITKYYKVDFANPEWYCIEVGPTGAKL